MVTYQSLAAGHKGTSSVQRLAISATTLVEDTMPAVSKKKAFSVAVDIQAAKPAASSSNSRKVVIDEVDKNERHKPQYATEYVSDIYRYFQEIEAAQVPGAVLHVEADGY